jgi:excisionase family DNA binding protein
VGGKSVRKSYLTPNQVAELLMVTPAAVRQWTEKGELSALTTLGGHRRFLPADVDRFAEKHGLTLNKAEEGLLRVLIVDDDEQFSGYLQQLLLEYADQVITDVAEDGFSAGIKMTEFKPQVVLLDLMMPNLNGFEACRLLRSTLGQGKVYIIAMTGYPTPENVKKIIAAGADVCLAKPIDSTVLLKHIGIN